MNCTVYCHDSLNQDEPAIFVVNASEEEAGLALRFPGTKRMRWKKENLARETEKLLKECGKLKEHDWMDYIFLDEL